MLLSVKNALETSNGWWWTLEVCLASCCQPATCFCCCFVWGGAPGNLSFIFCHTMYVANCFSYLLLTFVKQSVADMLAVVSLTFILMQHQLSCCVCWNYHFSTWTSSAYVSIQTSATFSHWRLSLNYDLFRSPLVAKSFPVQPVLYQLVSVELQKWRFSYWWVEVLQECTFLYRHFSRWCFFEALCCSGQTLFD